MPASPGNASGNLDQGVENRVGHRTWSNVPYPVEYEYDDVGRRTGMWTFRSGNFSGTAWPGGVGDKTTCVYEDATALLLRKLDAANQGPTYTYGPGGRLATRTWARGGTTTHGYDDATGELLSVDYSDPSTPDIGYTYDRLGRQKRVVGAEVRARRGPCCWA